MNKKQLLSLLAAVTLSTASYAQQDPMYTQYMFNMLGVNPAYAGSRNVLSVTGLYRNQWLGIDGAPVTQTLSVDFPVSNKRIGLGVTLVNDKIGIQKNLNAYLSYSYRLRLGKGVLSLGLQAGANNYSANFNPVMTNSLYNGGNGGGTQDPAFQQNFTKTLPNVGAGLYYSTDKFFLSLSAPKILQYSLSTAVTGISSANNIARQYRHFFLSSGFVLPLSENVKLKPSFLLKAVEGAPLELDINANLWFGGKFGIGASYRTGDSVDGMLEFQLTPQFRLGYAYDFTLTRLGKHTTGSHEILVRYETGYGKRKVISPRYF